MAKVKGSVRFQSDHCKGCGLCVSVCPLDLLTLSEEQVNLKGYLPAKVKRRSQCKGCGFCANMCPDSVISVKRFTRMKRNYHA